MLPTNSQDVDNFIVFGSINTFTYTNHRGEVSTRKVIPLCLRFNSAHISKEYPEYYDEWILECFDIEKNDYRSFALKNIEHRT